MMNDAERASTLDPKSVPGGPCLLSIRHAAFAQIDDDFRRKWARLIAAAPYGHYQQRIAFTELRVAMGWDAEVFWIEDDDRFLLGATVLRERLGFLPAAVAMIAGGPLWLPGNEYLIGRLLSEVRISCRAQGAIFCRMDQRIPLAEISAAPELPAFCRESAQVWSYWNLPRAVMTMDIRDEPERILKGMHLQHRRSYHNSIKAGVRIVAGTREQIAELVRLLSQMSDRKHVLVRDEGYLQHLYSGYPPDDIRLTLATFAGRIIGATLMVVAGQTAYYLYGAFDYEHRHLYPNVALQMEMIRWARERGCESYDLGGTCTSWPPSQQDPGYGVYLFKRRMGATVQLLVPYRDMVCRPMLYRTALLVENVGMPLLLEKGRSRFSVAWRRASAELGRSHADAAPRNDDFGDKRSGT